MQHDFESKSRLLAKLLNELLNSNQFACLADLTDALKGRCSKLKIQYRDDDITGAMRLVATNRELAARAAVLQAKLTTKPIQPEGEIIPRAAASRIYDEIITRYRSEHPAPIKPTIDGPEHFPSLMPI